MKISSISSSSSSISQLLFAFWAVAAGPVGAFVAPAPQRALGAGQVSGGLAVGALRADASSSQSSSSSGSKSSNSSKSSRSKVGTAPAEIADMTRSMRNQMRDAIWKASDAMSRAVEDVPSVGKPGTNEKLARLGDMVERIDEKYFGKYNRGTGATTSYLDSIGTAAAAAAEEAKAEAGKGVTGGSPKDDKPDKGKGGDKKAAKAASDAASTASSAVAEAKDAAAKSSKKDDTPAEAATAAVDAAVDSVKAKADKSAESAAGTVQLDRPKQVQGVFDDFQKKAVEYYKSSPVAKATSSVPGTKFGSSSSGGVATPMPDAVQTLEAELESLLAESSFKPRRLKKERKQKLVAAIEAMEKAYPADANPLGDPALSGQWSVVYSSSSRSIGRALKGALAKLFKTSDTRQVVNSEASSIINACRARLRLTPLSLQVAQKGKYRATAERKVSVDLSVSGGKKLLRGLLPGLRAGKVSAEVTYLSNRWRICRVGGVTVAFRKTGD